MDCSDDSHVPVSPGSAHPQVPRLRVGSLGNAGRMRGAHLISIHIPHRRDAELDVEISLRELDALVGAASVDVAAAALPGTLVHAVTLGADTIIA